MVNTNKLKGLIREQQKTQVDCAMAIGVKQAPFCQKINNTREFWLKESRALANYLQIDDSEFMEYFFAD